MVTIVSLGWNENDLTNSFLERLKRYTDIPHSLIFTDNGSAEPMAPIVKKYYPQHESIVITKKQNVGCPATRNEAMKYVETDICFWLDNDCMVGPNWYQPILDKLEDDSIGISGVQGYEVKYPFELPYPFEAVIDGDCDYFMGWLMGFKTQYYKPINDYKIPVNLDDVECCWGIKSNGKRAVVSEPCFAKHLVSATKRGWEFNDQVKLKELWNNWGDKSIFNRYRI